MNQRPDIKNDILISIRPDYADQIIEGCKTVELRRRFTEEVDRNTRLFIYSSNPVGAIVACARIDKVTKLSVKQIWKKFHKEACVDKVFFEEYFDGTDFGFVVSLGKVTPLNESLDREDILDLWGIRPPQSYMYLPADVATAISSGTHEVSSRHKHNSRNRR
jgi:predicted transcriptional regulator